MGMVNTCQSHTLDTREHTIPLLLLSLLLLLLFPTSLSIGCDMGMYTFGVCFCFNPALALRTVALAR